MLRAKRKNVGSNINWIWITSNEEEYLQGDREQSIKRGKTVEKRTGLLNQPIHDIQTCQIWNVQDENVENCSSILDPGPVWILATGGSSRMEDERLGIDEELHGRTSFSEKGKRGARSNGQASKGGAGYGPTEQF